MKNWKVSTREGSQNLNENTWCLRNNLDINGQAADHLAARTLAPCMVSRDLVPILPAPGPGQPIHIQPAVVDHPGAVGVAAQVDGALSAGEGRRWPLPALTSCTAGRPPEQFFVPTPLQHRRRSSSRSFFSCLR
jgi:hypothetical protein